MLDEEGGWKHGGYVVQPVVLDASVWIDMSRPRPSSSEGGWKARKICFKTMEFALSVAVSLSLLGLKL